jgi:hypothetical protein
MKELSIGEKAKAYGEAVKTIGNIRIFPNHKDFIKL